MRRQWGQSNNQAELPGIAGFFSYLFEKLEPPPVLIPRRVILDGQACCPKRDAKHNRECTLCAAPACNNCRRLLNGQWICASCHDDVQAMLIREQATRADLPRTLAFGTFLGAIAGGFWALVAIATGYMLYIAAIILGLVAGYGTHAATGWKRGPAVQWVAALSVAISIVVGRYFISIYFYNQSADVSQTVSPFDANTFGFFIVNFAQFATTGDLISLLPAAFVAFIIPRNRVVALR